MLQKKLWRELGCNLRGKKAPLDGIDRRIFQQYLLTGNFLFGVTLFHACILPPIADIAITIT
jgi:hypothetical protein